MGIKQKLKKIIQIILSIMKKLSKKMKKYYYIIIPVCLIIGGFFTYKRVENFDDDVNGNISVGDSKDSPIQSVGGSKDSPIQSEGGSGPTQSKSKSVNEQSRDRIEKDLRDMDVENQKLKEENERLKQITQQQALDKLGITGWITPGKVSGDLSISNDDNKNFGIKMDIFKKGNVKGEIKILDRVCTDKDKLKEKQNLKTQLEQEKSKWFFQRWS